MVEVATETYDVVATDLMGDAPNYSTVERFEVTVKAHASQAVVVRAVKAALGWTGERCAVEATGDGWDIRPTGAALVAFVTYRDH